MTKNHSAAVSAEDEAPRELSISQRAMRRPAGADYLDALNPEQRDAVETTEGPLLVLAGAGTGKTRVLTTRIGHILNLGKARPSEILAVTFTNKAAREMRSRIGDMIGGAVEGMPWLGTFHAIGVKILRRHAELVDLKPSFTVLDVDDQIRLMKQLLSAENIDEKRWPARMLAGLIDSWKNRGLTPDRIPEGESFAFGNGKGAQLYAAYQKRLKELNVVDFGDLLLENLRLFREQPEVLERYQQRFRYMLVDEYQDTNVAQYLWLRLLAQGKESPNLCCVGDDDQSIYGWRGAEVDNILRFETDFPGAKVIRLERNYRSTGHILGAAAGLITHNEGRLGKTLHTEDVAGEKVEVRGCWDEEEEARLIGEDIEQLQRQGHNLSEIAILVRASFQMRAFEDRFLTLGLPYRVIGGPRFYERQEIRDAIAYLAVTLNPANDIKFERIVNVPRRGLGDSSVKAVHQLARSRDIPLTQAARLIVETEELTARARKSLASLIGAFDRWRKLIDSMPHTELAELILDESGYTAMWQNEKSPQAQTRLDNLKELIRFMEAFDSLAGFLEHVSLVMDTETDDTEDRVNLMTLHSAKGLEFDTVFLPGWEEGLCPHQRSLDDQGRAGLEEERRLGHVGLTRARKAALISFAQNRRTHGTWQAAIPSRFIDELPIDHVTVAEERSYGGYGASRFDNAETVFAGGFYDTPGWQRAKANRAANQGGPRRREPMTIEGTLVAASTAQGAGFRAGMRVFHQKFGYGSIASVDGNKLTVDFEKAGRKKVVDSFVERA
ncbi:UvrD-helicase domain-containing protein [Methyloligella sp. 2.7D]|uniref:UvrD-helicase domain-containing protein n=1 Tax=unclassified Methyloligella TaxID=2625955 RepID=UPI00157D8759|nr:UvrD-helicase domain-containing protein [Methyloligella sp. GL2]QKP77975.1 UvrD-helicase domain-containing protein [Methyloligella sp. GL2]